MGDEFIFLQTCWTLPPGFTFLQRNQLQGTETKVFRNLSLAETCVLSLNLLKKGLRPALSDIQ